MKIATIFVLLIIVIDFVVRLLFVSVSKQLTGDALFVCQDEAVTDLERSIRSSSLTA